MNINYPTEFQYLNKFSLDAILSDDETTFINKIQDNWSHYVEWNKLIKNNLNLIKTDNGLLKISLVNNNLFIDDIIKFLENLYGYYINNNNNSIAYGTGCLMLRLELYTYGCEHKNTINRLIQLIENQLNLEYYIDSLEISNILLYWSTKEFGELYPDTVECMNYKAISLNYLGETKKAIPLFEEIYKLSIQLYGSDNIKSAISMNNLATCYQALGDFDKAKTYYNEYLMISTKIGGNKDKNRLMALNNLSCCLQGLSDFKNALPLITEAVKLRKEVLGDDHPDTMESLNNLASCYQETGNYSKALDLYRKVKTWRTNTLGDYHNSTLESQNNLAFCLDSKGHSKEAFVLFRKTLLMRIKKFGRKHRLTLTSIHNLGFCYLSLSHYKKALIHFKYAVKYRKALFSEKHHEYLLSLNNTANCLTLLGRFNEALALYEKTLDSQLSILGKLHHDSLETMANQAYCLCMLKRIDEALPIYYQVLKLRTNKLSNLHPRTISSLTNFAHCLDAIAWHKEALPLHEIAYESFCKTLGNSHPETLISLNNLAYCHNILGNAKTALKLYNNAFFIYEKKYGKKQTILITILNNMASCHVHLGKTYEALKLYEQALQLSKDLLGQFHPISLNILNNLAVYYDKTLNDQTNALRLQLECVSLLKEFPQLESVWLHILYSVSSFFNKYTKETNSNEWIDAFHTLNTALLMAQDLQLPEQNVASRTTINEFYSTYLQLCISQGQFNIIPSVLASIQGRKLNAKIQDQLETQFENTNDQLLNHYFNLRDTLRKLSMELSITYNDISSMHRYSSRKNELDELSEKLNNYHKIHNEYLSIKDQLYKKYPQLNRNISFWKPDILSLQENLKKTDVIIIIFNIQVKNSFQYYALIIHINNYTLLHLQNSFETLPLRAYIQPSPGHRGVHSIEVKNIEIEYTNDNLNTEKSCSLSNNTIPLVLEKFWFTISNHITNIENLHIITHGYLHTLPFSSACPDNITLFSYPGLIYYYQQTTKSQKQQPIPSPTKQSTISISSNDSLDSKHNPPIPMVNTEAQMVSALWPGDIVTQSENISNLHSALYCCHGDYDVNRPTESFLLLHDNYKLNFNSILKSKWPAVIFLSSCLVGRVNEDPDGDPLGLISAFFLQEVRIVISALQPISDFYMPILSSLFYQTWIEQQCSPHEALKEAKKRLKSGNWYATTIELIQKYYPATLENTLLYYLNISNDDKFIACTDSWPLPEPYKRRKSRLRMLPIKSERKKFSNTIIDVIINHRESEQINDLVANITIFGS